MTGWEEILERETLTKEERKKVCGWLMTTESHMNNLIASYFTVKDFKAVWERRHRRKGLRHAGGPKAGPA